MNFARDSKSSAFRSRFRTDSAFRGQVIKAASAQSCCDIAELHRVSPSVVREELSKVGVKAAVVPRSGPPAERPEEWGFDGGAAGKAAVPDYSTEDLAFRRPARRIDLDAIPLMRPTLGELDGRA